MRHALPLLVAALLLAGCASDAPPDDGSAVTTPPATTTPTTAEPMAVTVTVGESPTPGAPPKLYTLEPARLELHVGMPVNLTLVNAGQGPHDLHIEGLDVHIDTIGGGESASVEFTPTEAGTFAMYCTLGAAPADHRALGMAGEVVVT